MHDDALQLDGSPELAALEASLPEEMIETIVRTYERRGRLTMSDDGGAYRIRFTS